MSNATPRTPSDIPEVHVIVTSFRRIATTLEPRRYCGARIEVPAEFADILEIKGGATDPIVVVKQKTDIRFVVRAERKKSKRQPAAVRLATCDPDSLKTEPLYVPLGIAFRQIVNGRGGRDPMDGGRDTVGKCDFRREAPSFQKASIIVRNRFVPDRPPYEFYIMIQRSTDGEIGIIDPGIDNQDPE